MTSDHDPLAGLQAWWAMPDEAKQESAPPVVLATLREAVAIRAWSAQNHRFETGVRIEAGTRVRVTTISSTGAFGITGNLYRRWGFDVLVDPENLTDFSDETAEIPAFIPGIGIPGMR